MKIFGWTFGAGWLKHSVTVYVPSTRNVHEPLADEEFEALIQRTGEFLTERFGGATAIPAFGYYIDKEGALVPERVTKVYAFTGRLTSEDRKAVFAYAAALRDEFGQESISVEIDNKLTFI